MPGGICGPLPCLRHSRAFSQALKRFAGSKGAAGKYHETITVAYMLLIAERLDGARQLTWSEFAAANPDLLAWYPSVLATYYSEALVASDRARRVFVMPDRLGAEPDR